MRVAVLSDIHGFDLALERVYDDLQRTGPYDRIVVAGDLCVVGPAPRLAIDLLRGTDWTVLHGNTDVDLVEAARGSGFVPFELDYAIEQIGAEGVAYLAELPFAHRIRPEGGASPDDDLLVVHANPHNVNDRIMPEMSDRTVREVLGESRQAALAFGHYHVCFIRELDDTLLVDVAAVGNPKDGDLRCKYGVLTWDPATRRWTAELRKLDYPLDETRAQIMNSALPDPERTWRKLQRASYR